MRRALLLSLCMSSTTFAVTGDWKIWSQTGSARQTVVRAGQTVLAATPGGIISWNPATSTGRILTNLDGLPTLDIASLVADSSGSIWAIGTDGRMAVLEAGASNWNAVGSYHTSQWTFSPAAATFWNGVLVLGGPQGLTFFSTKDRVATDYTSTFGTLRDTVTAVFASGDSLWVATPSGIAIATDPVWATDSAAKHLGRAGYYLNSLKWNVAKPPLPDSLRVRYRIRRDSAGVHPVLAGQWTNYNPALQGLKLDFGLFTAPELSAQVPGAQDAVATNWGYFFSTTNGLVQLAYDGTVRNLAPSGSFPDVLPVAVSLSPDGIPHVLSSLGYSSTRVWRRTSSGDWTSDTIEVQLPQSPSKVVRPTWYIQGDTTYPAKPMAFLPNGELVLASWEDPTTMGGFLVSKGPGNWKLWNHSNDTCLAERDLAGVSGRSLRRSASGMWASLFYNTSTQPLVHLTSSTEAPGCLMVDPSLLTTNKTFTVNDLLERGDTLWLAANEGLVRAVGIQTSPGATRSARSGLGWTAHGFLQRLVYLDFGGRGWLVAAGSGFLGAIPSTATATDTFHAVQKTTQNYVTLAQDAQGNVWAGGTEGLDIWTPSLDDSGSLTLQLTRKIRYEDGLPSERVLDVALDSATGRAVIATSSAVAVWTSPYRPIPAKLAKSTVRVWPNPVRLRQNRTLYVDGATLSADFDLFSADGTLVLHQASSQSASFQIQLPTTSKMRPGIYYWSLKDSRGSIHGPLLVGE